MRKNDVNVKPVRPRNKTAQLAALLEEISTLRKEHSRQRKSSSSMCATGLSSADGHYRWLPESDGRQIRAGAPRPLGAAKSNE